ncbi:MAG: YceI family protein [Pseudomonadota bacterium]
MKFKQLIVTLIAASATSAFAQTYNIDPTHTFPSFEADHFGGISILRGMFTKTSGTVKLDAAAKTGALDIVIEADSLMFGNANLTKHAKGADMFDVEKYPTITYKSKSFTFDGGKPVAVDGDLTLHGVTKPVKLTINKFKCFQHPMLKREVCGADVAAEFKRSDFGINYGLPTFSPEVRLLIEVEAAKAD